ncbi:MAG: O-antigen ligase family protein [Actinobacteria bacterium]|nr:O-antigen ligase family protein [Actinomycetota bacterium]
MLETDAEHGPTGDDDTGTATQRLGSIAPTRDLVVIAGAVLLCIAFAPVFVSAPFSARFAILLGFLPWGLVAIGFLAIERDRAAIAGVALICVAVVSSLLSDHVRISLFGQLGKEESALLVTAFVGWWAIGGRLSSNGRRLLPYALLIGLGVNAVVAILQVAVGTESSGSEFGIPEGTRAIGLTANPVQLGALMAAGVALSSTLGTAGTGRRWWLWLIPTALFAAAANLSGTRVALIGIAVVLLGLLVIRRSFRVVAMLGATAIGFAIAMAIDRSGGSASTSRLTHRQAGRSDVWRFGLQSFLDRPILGHGPGGFRPAVQGRFTADFIVSVGSDDRHLAWFDAHNVAIEYLVITGIVGVVLLAAFAWFALRTARGPLLAAFIAIAITWTMQPMSVSTAPVALLCLGAAGPVRTASRVSTRSSVMRVTQALAVGVGLLAACAYAFIDLRLDAAIRDGDAVAIENAARPFGNDAVVADLVAQGWANAYFYDGADRSHLVKWAAEPALREPDRPYWWSKLAGTRLAFQDYEGARDALDRAIALQPWSPSAWPLMLSLAKKTDDAELEALATEKVCELQLDSCPDLTDG